MPKRISLPDDSGAPGHIGGSTMHAWCGRLEPALLRLHQATGQSACWNAIIRLIECALPYQHLMAVLACDGTADPAMMTTLPHDKIKALRLGNHTPPPMDGIMERYAGIKLLDPDQHLTERELSKSPFRTAVLAPNGLRHSAALLFWEENWLSAHVGVYRTAAQGRFSDGEKGLLMNLHPHIEAAIRRVALNARQELVCSVLREALEHPSNGVMLLDAQCRIMLQNQAAGLACRFWKNGKAAAATQLQTGKMVDPPNCLLEKARELLSCFREDGRNKSLQSGGYECEMCHQDGEWVSARVRVVAPKRRQVPPHVRIEFSRLLKSMPSAMPGLPVYRLSACEHRVALLVARGLRNKVVAAELGLSVHTVRSHLREIFSKLGVDHRGQLATMIAHMEPAEPDYSV